MIFLLLLLVGLLLVSLWLMGAGPSRMLDPLREILYEIHRRLAFMMPFYVLYLVIKEVAR